MGDKLTTRIVKFVVVQVMDGIENCSPEPGALSLEEVRFTR